MSAAAFLTAWADVTEQRRGELDALDAASGDGDHGSTVARGAAAAAVVASAGGADGPVLVAASRAFTDAAGGASGPLLGTVLRCLGTACGDGALGSRALADGLVASVVAVRRLGRCEVGDGTLLDALAAAADHPSACAQHADAAATATTTTPKRRGRAARVEGAGIGHEDPGARSVAVLLATLTSVVPVP